MTHPGVSLDLTLRLVAQEVKSAGLRDVIAAIGMGGKAGGVVRHGVNGTAMDHTVGVLALRLDVQPEYGVIFLYREDYYEKESENHNLAECIIAKNRHGETRTVELQWLPEYTTFSSIDRTHEEY